MLAPKKTKHRKWHRRIGKGNASRAVELSFGSFGLKAESAAQISSRQIEAARRAIVRYVRKGGKLWIRIFPDRPVTRKGTEVPMGGGKGSVDHYVFVVKPGRILFEIDGISEEIAREALRRGGAKLSVRSRFVKREHV